MTALVLQQREPWLAPGELRQGGTQLHTRQHTACLQARRQTARLSWRASRRLSRRRRPSEERLLDAFLEERARAAPPPAAAPPSPGTRSALAAMFFSLDDGEAPNQCAGRTLPPTVGSLAA
jgi:hypothetical protein